MVIFFSTDRGRKIFDISLDIQSLSFFNIHAYKFMYFRILLEEDENGPT